MTYVRKLLSAAVLTATIVAGTATMSFAANYSKEITNLIHFHLIDFVGWNNNDMDVMRKYHGPEVAVDMVGVHTDGIDPHVAMIGKMLSSGAAKVTQHSPSLAQGDWTAVVGITAGGNMATIGKWKNGALSDEYLFVRPLIANQIKAVDVSKPIVTVTTPDDQALRSATGAEKGWSAVMADGYAIFTQTVDGKVAQQLGFASK